MLGVDKRSIAESGRYQYLRPRFWLYPRRSLCLSNTWGVLVMRCSLLNYGTDCINSSAFYLANHALERRHKTVALESGRRIPKLRLCHCHRYTSRSQGKAAKLQESGLVLSKIAILPHAVPILLRSCLEFPQARQRISRSLLPRVELPGHHSKAIAYYLSVQALLQAGRAGF